MKKILIISGVVLAVFVAGYVGAINVGLADNPMKVTDPSDPRFDPDAFRFEDYLTKEELIDAFRKLFPPGTPKEFVDRALIKAGGAQSWESDSIKNLFYYREPENIVLHFKQPPNNGFIFNERLEVINIWVRNGDEIYKDQQSFEDFQKEGTKKFLEQKEKRNEQP